MKIDHNRSSLDPAAGAKPEGVRDERTAAADKAARDERVGADRVRVSTTGQLAATAAQAAAEAPEVRADAVARARARLEAGDLGDPGRIADAIIDATIDATIDKGR
ncbi:MAG: flagellar biosynthesis anti-sigma factor FlgM [Vicinamibacterales bacterium]